MNRIIAAILLAFFACTASAKLVKIKPYTSVTITSTRLHQIMPTKAVEGLLCSTVFSDSVLSMIHNYDGIDAQSAPGVAMMSFAGSFNGKPAIIAIFTNTETHTIFGVWADGDPIMACGV